MAPDLPRTSRTLGVVLALTLLALATRAPLLDADPARFKRVSELYDEGYWAHNARAAVLFGTRYPDDLAQAPASAPLFHWTTEAVFRAVGVGYAPLRATSVVASALLVPIVWVLVAVGAGSRAALAAALLVLGNHELFAFGRLGLPESLQLLLAVAGAATWMCRRRPGNAVASGVLLALAVLAKLNVVLVVGFAGVWVLEAWQRRLALRDLGAFAAGFVPVIAAWAVFLVLPDQALFQLNQLALNRDRLAQQWSDLVRLPLHFVDAGFWGLPSTYLLALLAVLPLVGDRARLRAGVAALTPIETLALGWLAGIVAPTALLVRAVDERRLLLVSVLLAALAALNWRRAVAEPRVEAHGAPPVPRGSASRRMPSALSIGTALVIVGVSVAVVFHAGWGRRLWSAPGAALIVAGATALILLADRLRGPRGRRTLGVMLVAALALLPAVNVGRFVRWLLTGVDAGSSTLVAVAAALTLVATVLVVVRRDAVVVRAVTVAYAVYAVLAIGVNAVAPTYTLRDASRAMGSAAPAGSWIVGAMAHTLSLENQTRPLWYTPDRALNRLLNPDLARFDVRLVLTVTPPSPFFPDAGSYPFPLTPVGRLALYPAPHLVSTPPPPKVALTLYRRAD